MTMQSKSTFHHPSTDADDKAVSPVALELPPDDPSRHLSIIDPDDPTLRHISMVGDTYTILLSGADTSFTSSFRTTPISGRTATVGENRVRFAVEVATAIVAAIGPTRVGFRVSPGNRFNDIVEDDAPELYDVLLAGLSPLGLAYLHHEHHGDDEMLARFRSHWASALVVNRPNAELETRFADIAHGRADMVAIGKMALANPDLVSRIKSNAPLNKPDPSTFFSEGARGYTDYPTAG